MCDSFFLDCCFLFLFFVYLHRFVYRTSIVDQIVINMECKGVCLVRRGAQLDLSGMGCGWTIRPAANIQPDIVFSSQGVSVSVVIVNKSPSNEALERISSLKSFRWGIVMMEYGCSRDVEVVQAVIK